MIQTVPSPQSPPTHTTLVPSGAMKIGDHGTLKACLGSCVGVAIHDRKHQRGGLIHLLLPEPICEIPLSDHIYYATYGIEMLLKRILTEDTSPADLEATIAGGALVDPLSRADLNLNLGGRTVEIALAILKKEGISIRRLEASGFTPLNLVFRPHTGECTLEAIFPDEPHPPVHITRPSRDDILRTIDRAQPIPQLAIKIAGMLSSEGTDFADIATEIKKDQIITARVLRLCNSPYVKPLRPITSVDQAMVMLGSRLLLKVVITAQTEQYLIQYNNGYSLNRGGMFTHAVGMARFCEQLAAFTPDISPDSAFTAGLLHDIGKVVLDQFVAPSRPLFYRMLLEEHGDAIEVEQDFFGINHCQAGQMLAENWRLPPMFTEVIAMHHQPREDLTYAPLVHLVYVCDVLTNRFMSGFELDQMDSGALERSLSLLGLSPRDLYRALPRAVNID